MLAALLLLLVACQKHPTDTGPDLLGPRPMVAASPAWAPTAPVAQPSLSNGLQLWTVERTGLPLVSVRLVIPGGSALDPVDRPGEASLADTLLLHGAGSWDAAAFAERAERLAIDLEVTTHTTATVISLTCEAARLDDGLALLAEAVQRPRFDPATVEQQRELRLADIAQEADDARTTAIKVSQRELYGAMHPFGHLPTGTAAGVQATGVDQLRASWTRRARTDGSLLLFAGAVPASEAKALAERHFGAWKPAAGPVAPPIPPPTFGAKRIFVDMPEASQTVLRVVMPGWTAADPSLDAARLGAIVLGGTFTSRLNRLLREEKGYTYGASARLDSGRSMGTMVAATSVQREVTAPALTDLMGELRKIKAGITAEELSKAVGAHRQDQVEAMGSNDGIAGTYAGQFSVGLGTEALALSLSRSASLERAAVDAALQGIDPDNAGLIVVVGDLSKVRSSVEAAMPGAWTVVTP
jgi:predicted Zn-dependent peptidase